MAIIWNYTAAITENSAIAACKLGYDYGSVDSGLAVFTMVYDKIDLFVYRNGVLIDQKPNGSSMRILDTIVIGGEFDNRAHFKGVMPEMVFFEDAMDNPSRQAYENYLADKWLPTGKTINGHVINDSPVRPLVSNARFLEFDETGLNVNGSNRITSWDDSSLFDPGRIANPNTGYTLAFDMVKGKRAARWDSKCHLTVSPQSNPAYRNNTLTFMFVCMFDDYDTNGYAGETNQTILSAAENTALRIKKYDDETEFSFRITTTGAGNTTCRIPKSDMIPVDFIEKELGYLSLFFGEDPLNLVQYGDAKAINNYSDYGIGHFPMADLLPDKQYYGAFRHSFGPAGTDSPQIDPDRQIDYDLSSSPVVSLSKNSEVNSYTTARSNVTLSPATGKFYFEVQQVANSSVSWIGFSEPLHSPATAIGTVSWSVSSNGRRFNHQTGGGNAWAGTNSQWVPGDRIGILLDSDTGTMSMYKNGTLVGIVFSGLVTEEVELTFCIDRIGSMNLFFSKSEWMTSPQSDWKQIPGKEVPIDPSSAFTFKTLPGWSKSFKLVTGSCNDTGSNAVTWAKIKEESPDLLVHLGDLHYQNIDSPNGQDHARGLDIAMSTEIKKLLRTQGWTYMYDNHDSIGSTINNTWVNFPPFCEWWSKSHVHYPLGSSDPRNDGNYYSFTIGRARCIITDSRSQRDVQNGPDHPGKTMLGIEQKEWFKSQMIIAKNSPMIDMVIWFSSVIWTSDINDPFSDSFLSGGPTWGSYPHEQAEIANFLYDNKIRNVLIVCGDNHSQAIDDGRNSMYITDNNGDRVDPNSIPKEYWTPMFEASPFDRYLQYRGGPFQINDEENSGGPVPSYEQSYGVIDVNDQGEDWIQIKLYTVSWTGTEWIRNRYYTYNLKTKIGSSGKQGIPPPLNWGEERDSTNGAIGKGGEWKPIEKRWIEKDSFWKPVLYKFKFINGFWKKIFDGLLLNPNIPLVLVQLNGYTAETYAWVKIDGYGFLEASYPTKFGAYYEMSSGFSDTFDNYPSLTRYGTPEHEAHQGVRCLKINSNVNYYGLPTIIDAGITGHDFYNRDFFMGIWVNFPVWPSQTVRIWGYENPSTNLWTGIYLNSSGKVIFKVEGVDYISSRTINPNGWHSISVNFKNAGNGDWSFLFIDGTKDSLSFSGVVMPNVSGTPEIFIGKAFDSTSTEPNFFIANLHFTPRYQTNNAILRFHDKPGVKVRFRNQSHTFIVPGEWMMGTKADSLSFTIPPGTPPGTYDITVESLNYSSNSLPFRVISSQVRSTPYITDFSDPREFNENWNVMNKAWGGANGGVVAENLKIKRGMITCVSHGDYYTGDVQGADRDGAPKFHTHPDDPKLGQPWTHRVGACFQMKEKTGFGSYRMRARFPDKLGVCHAIWTFFYNEIYPGDPRWQEFIDQGLHIQGNLEDGFYITRNHEIDIEFPSHLPGGNLWQPSFRNIKANTWQGELQNWDVPESSPLYWEEYHSELVSTLTANCADGNYHEWRFDWHWDRVEFYIDGMLIVTNRNEPNSENIPFIAGNLVIGSWFPSSPIPSKPWLARGEKAWAGGQIESPDQNMIAPWDKVELDIIRFEYHPYLDEFDKLEVVGETYPFGGFRAKGESSDM